MKLMKLFSPGIPALMMSCGVTIGAMYVTISAAGSDTATLPVADPGPAVDLADAAAEPVAPLADSTVRLTEDGRLVGRLSTIISPSGELLPSPDITVNLFPLKGPELSTQAGFDGVFEFSDMTPGIYTLKARGEMGAISMAIRVVRDYDTVADGRGGEISAAAIPVARFLDLQLDAAMAGAGSLDVIEYLIEKAEVTPDDSEPHGGQISSGDSEDDGFGDDSDESSYLSHRQIQLQPDGSLRGRVSLISRETAELMPVSSLTVSFVQDGEIVAATDVTSDGTFIQHNLLPGVYAMVVAGNDGVGYIGVDVIGGLADQQQNPNVIPVSYGVAQDTATIGIVKGEGGGGGGDGSGDDDSDGEGPGTGVADGGPPADPAPAPAGGAPAGGIPNAPGGGVGGGGSFGGDGGIGGLLGLAGAALGAAALLDDDDSSTTASPGI